MDENKSKITLVGKTNDCNFSTIQEALDSVEDNSTIHVKPGIYNEHLSFTKKVHLIGCNESIKNKSSAELPIVVLDSDKSCEIDVSVEIEGIVFTHKKDLQFEKLASFVKTPLEFENKDYEMKNFDDEAFKSLLWIKSESTFTNIAILCTEDYGITFSGIKSSFKTSFVHHTYSAGILIVDDSKTDISNSSISDSNVVGIAITGVSTSSVTNCEFFNNDVAGIMVAGSATPIIDSCKIEKNNNFGIYLLGDANPSCMSCEIQDEEIGILMTESASGLYKNCNIHHTDRGIKVTDTVSSQIIKCEIHDNKFYGICSDEQSKSIINDCEIFDNQEMGISANDDSTLEIVNCKLYKNKYGILSKENSNPIVKMCEFYNHEVGIFIGNTANGVFEKCLIYNCNGYGILLDDKHKTTVQNCVICKNGSGIYVQDGILQIKQCEIYENLNSGIEIFSKLSGIYDNCDIHNNKKTGITGLPSKGLCFDTCKVYNNEMGNIKFLDEVVNDLVNVLSKNI